MDDPPAATVPKICCVCSRAGGRKHCTNCKSRHYCSKACQLVDWSERGHKAQCKQMAADFQDRLLEEIMPAKLKIKEEPAVVDDVAPAYGSKAFVRASSVWTAATDEAGAASGVPSWRGICAVCLDVLPVEAERQTFSSCCCKRLCTECANKCLQYDDRCPHCRALASKSPAEWLRRMQKHADEGNADEQVELGDTYRDGGVGLTKSLPRALQLYALAAAQGHAPAQHALGCCHLEGDDDYETALLWYRRAAAQGYAVSAFNLGDTSHNGEGVAQSDEEAVKWYRLSAAQGYAEAFNTLGNCHMAGRGVAKDVFESIRNYKFAAARGHAGAVLMLEKGVALVLDRTLSPAVDPTCSPAADLFDWFESQPAPPPRTGSRPLFDWFESQPAPPPRTGPRPRSS